MRSQVEDVLSEIKRCAELNERVLITTLTKRMAEDLTEYLHEHGVRVRYLHSDIETVERVEIIRDLRLGKFDVLVGINLLREGLDMPEVSLVAILDADKEGFLRSDRFARSRQSGARHAISRARPSCTRTGSPARCSGRSTRPTAGGRSSSSSTSGTASHRAASSKRSPTSWKEHAARCEEGRKIDDPTLEYGNVPPEQIVKRIKKLEQEMFRLARNLEFEEAAKLRDQIERMRKVGLGLGSQLAS